ncbi:MAG: chromosome segregation protein SMC [Oscillospiraceae bacterium]|nr:chromosome segregation protein SMC [Oscillospiraceae bacterium]
MRRLYLKALEIQGFKSFPDKIRLSFGEDITAIVGPNGSGKSNISDAIRWVMGEQSTKALRGGKMEDVIFGGTEKRRQLGFAEVSLVLDNSEHIVPLEDTEVMVTRRYYRSGESEYYINHRTVRLRDVNELFMDTGLGREGYSIIGQGKIDEILSVKSGDRREVFEEAAGISRFRHRKEEAERKLERTEENLVRINDKIDELELQVEPLRLQAEKAKKFLIYRDELRSLEISVWLEQLEKLRVSSAKILSDYDNALRQKETAQEDLTALYAAVEEYTGQMRERDAEIEEIRARIAARESEASACESAIAVLQANIQNNLDNEAQLREELTQRKVRADAVAEQMAERRARLLAIEQETADTRQSMQGQEAQLHALSTSAGTLEEEMEQLRHREALEHASVAEARALLSALAAAAQELHDRDDAVRRELDAGEARLREAEQESGDVLAELDAAKESREALQNVINGYQLRAKTRRTKAEEAGAAAVKLQMEENALLSRIHMLREMEKVYEGYSKAVRLVMGEAERGALQGIHGPVAGLIQVPDRYAVAIEIALGGAMQHIVTEREEDGKNAISYLKRRDSGRATFLPLEAIRPSDFRDGAVAGEPGFLGMGDALLTFDPKYKNIFSSLLGRTVIAENMDRAIAMARKFGRRFKIVTLDGQVLNPGGSMTGGSVSRSAGILSRANELTRLDEQGKDVSKRLRAAQDAQKEAEREATAAIYELETAQGEQRGHEDTILKLEERCAHLESVLGSLHRQRDARTEELAQLGSRAAQNEADAEAARARIAQLEGTAAALRAQADGKSAGQSDLQEQQSALRQGISDEQLRLTALEAERQSSLQSLQELEKLYTDLNEDHTGREEMAAVFTAKNEALTAQAAEQETALRAIRAENGERQAEVARLNEARLALEGERTRLDRESRDKNNELLAMEREVSTLEQKKVTADMEEKQLLDKLWDTYELSHEAARTQRVELENMQQAQKRIGELRRAIASLGNINLDAVEEYQRVNERYTYLTEQRDDVQSAKKELEEIIAGITEEMRTIFAREFKVINEAFQETFLELFRGGRANLELEDPDDILNCGIEIRVQPPGKALKVITLLSGGEKAFVAIALYFAILKVRPTPFCVMDEIEAALDDANVVRYATQLRHMADKTQFIVITHRRGTMEEADVLYGVTMQEQGISRLLTINLNEAEQQLHLKVN